MRPSGSGIPTRLVCIVGAAQYHVPLYCRCLSAQSFLSPFQGFSLVDPNPGLSPWATFFRRYAAEGGRAEPLLTASLLSHCGGVDWRRSTPAAKRRKKVARGASPWKGDDQIAPKGRKSFGGAAFYNGVRRRRDCRTGGREDHRFAIPRVRSAKYRHTRIDSVARSGLVLAQTNPGLAPWAIVFRRYAAGTCRTCWNTGTCRDSHLFRRLTDRHLLHIGAGRTPVHDVVTCASNV